MYKNILIILSVTLFISGCESVDDSALDQAMQGETTVSTTTTDEVETTEESTEDTQTTEEVETAVEETTEVDASTDATSSATQ